MQKKTRNGISLAFEDSGSSKDALVLIHGWGCDHTTLTRQQEFFTKTHRVINVDLRGHGESDSPAQIYSVEAFADDVAWICQELDVKRASLIGHSMGGSVAVEVAFQHPHLGQSIGLIDTVFQPSVELMELLAPLIPALHSGDYESSYRSIMSALSLPSDQDEVSSVLRALPRAPQHVLLSALQQHLEAHDFARAAASCSVPVAYIGAARPLADLAKLKQLIPHLRTGQTLGAGHFAPWLVPEQVNAMLLRFFERNMHAIPHVPGVMVCPIA